MSEPIVEGWITTEEARALTGYAGAYLRQLVKQGQVEGYKVSRNWLLNRESLLAYKARMDALGASKHNPWRENPDSGRKRQNAKRGG